LNRSPVDGRLHRYFIDLWIKVKDKDGKIVTYLIEIKPESETKIPKKRKYITENYKKEVVTFAVNQAKWEAADKFAKKNGWIFKVMTETML
jgi:hypothetical protein